MFVRDWMSAPAVVIPPVVPAHAALGFMRKRKIRRLPVVEDGRLLGIVTQSDLQAAMGRGSTARDVGEASVADFMTRNPHVVDPADTLEQAAQIMLLKKISGLPVVEGERVVGIITESDVFRALCEMMGLKEHGARIVMSVGEDENVLEAIGKRLNGLAMKSLVTYHDAGHGRWEVVLRVRGRTAAQKRAM